MLLGGIIESVLGPFHHVFTIEKPLASNPDLVHRKGQDGRSRKAQKVSNILNLEEKGRVGSVFRHRFSNGMIPINHDSLKIIPVNTLDAMYQEAIIGMGIIPRE